jgi:four helix bundle protein
MGNFRSLEVWKLSKDLAVSIYKLTNIGKFSKDFGLRDQIRRAAVSISSNISEGDESGSNKHSIRYFNIAKGSSAEVITQAIIALEIGYIVVEEKENIVSQCELISKKLSKLIKYRSNNK